MTKRLLCGLLAAIMLLALLAPLANATETEAAETTSATEETAEATEETEAEEEEEEAEEEKKTAAKTGDCGKDVTWELKNNTLTISGTGAMDDGAPWATRKDKIKKVIFTGSVTYVGADAFSGCEALEAVDFGSALVEIGERAFLGCKSLTTIQLPATFRKFGAEAFRDCSDLETVYCSGPMPSFRGNCLWTGNTITVYTPLNNPWPQDSVQELVNNFGGRLKVIATGEVVYEEPKVEETTEETTEPTTVPTEAPTEPTTVPTTEEPTEPATEATTAPVETTVFTEPETEPQEKGTVQEAAEEVGSKGWIGLVLIAGVFTFLIIGALVFRGSRRKGGKYVE